MRPFLLALFLIVPIGGLAHWVIWRWAVHAFPRIERARRVVLFAVLAILLLVPVTRAFVVTRHSNVASFVQVLLFGEMSTMVLGAIPIAIIRGVSTLVARAGAKRGEDAAQTPEAPSTADPALEPGPAAPVQLSRRQIVEGIAGVAALGTTASALGWGIVRGRHAFAIEEVVVRVPGLPRVLDGYTIAQISDIHVGTFVGDRELSEGLSRLAEIRPDLVVATGDLVDFDASYAPQLARALADIRARDGVYAALGNHDHYAGADRVLRALDAAGVESLVNVGKRIRPADGGGFALLGVDDLSGGSRRRGGGPLLSRALAMVPGDAPRVLLSHQPSSVDLWAGKVALQLSGHTHGGQINPGFVPARLVMRYVAGRYDVGGTVLYVNRGFGTAGPPTRVMAPPEVTKVVLVSA